MAERFDEELVLASRDDSGVPGRLLMRVVDRINVDDVFLHMVNCEVYRLTTGKDPGAVVDPQFKDFLLKERINAGQG